MFRNAWPVLGTRPSPRLTAAVEAIDHLAIIAGNGLYPQLLASSARAAGVKELGAIAFIGETDSQLTRFVDEISWLHVGQLNRMLAVLRGWGATRAIMAGQIAPRNLFDLRPDWRALLLLAKVKQRNAETIFSAIGAELEKIGVTLLPATTFLESSLAAEGQIAGPKLSRRQEDDVEFGWNVAKQIASLDIGQTIVVKTGTVLAVEAFEGTDDALRRGARAGGGKAIAIKVAKPNQDMRFDVPVLGVETIRVASDAGIAVIAIETGRTLLLEKDSVVNAANKAGIAIIGR